MYVADHDVDSEIYRVGVPKVDISQIMRRHGFTLTQFKDLWVKPV
jgi:hypothetical protein